MYDKITISKLVSLLQNIHQSGAKWCNKEISVNALTICDITTLVQILKRYKIVLGNGLFFKKLR